VSVADAFLDAGLIVERQGPNRESKFENERYTRAMKLNGAPLVYWSPAARRRREDRGGGSRNHHRAKLMGRTHSERARCRP